jgi:hypothetical protein
VTDSETGSVVSEGDVDLPTLTPGDAWSVHIEWSVPVENAVLTFYIVRPTGFIVLERSYDAAGNLLLNAP